MRAHPARHQGHARHAHVGDSHRHSPHHTDQTNVNANAHTTPLTPAAPAPAGLDAEKDWTNTGTDVNTAGNWSPSGVPGSSDVAWFKVVKSTNPNLSSSATIAGLYFQSTTSSGYDITRTSTQTLTLNGTASNTTGGETSSSTAAAIGALNTSGTNTIDVPLVLGGGSVTQTFTQASGGTLVVNGIISGTINTLNMVGTSSSSGGTITLNGANTFTAGVTIDNGITVKLGNATALGAAANSVSVGANNSNGTLDLNGQSIANAVSITGSGASGIGALINSNTSTAATLSGTLDGSSTPTIGGSGNMTISGQIIASGSSALTKVGTGTVFFTNNTNNYTRPTTISAGILNIQANNALGATGSSSGTTVASGATLQMQNNITTPAEALTLNGTGASGQNGAFVNVSGTNNYGGLVTLGSASTISSDSGTLNLTNTGTITGSGFNLTLTGAGNGSISSIIGTGSGTLTKSGTGTWTLTGANTYTGATTVSAGILNIQNATALGTTAGGTTVNSGATLQIQGGITVGTEALNISGTGASGATGVLENVSGTNNYGGLLTLGAAATISSDAGTLNLTNTGTITGSGFGLTLAGTGSGTISSVIGTGTGTLTRTGTGGIWTLSGANTYTGGTTINSGVLQLSGSGTLGSTSGSLTVNGGALDLNGTNQGVGNLNGSGGLIYNNAASTNSTLTIGNGNATGGDYMGSIIAAGGTLALTKTGTGALTLSGSNSYAGATTISGGTLQLGDGGTAGSISGTSTITDNANLTIDRSNSVTQLTDLNNIAIAGTGSFTQLGTGTTTLSVANSYSGGTTVTAGTLKMSGSGTLGSTSGTLTVNGGTLDLNSTSQTVGALNGTAGAINTSTGSSTLTVGNGGGTGSYAGTIANGSGTVALTKTGAGTETLTGANTYTGATNANGGSLFINGNQSVATGAVNVNNSGTTLGGSGTIGGSVTVNSGANLAPGATGTGSNAKLNTGALTLASTSNFKVDITGAGETLGTPNSPNAGINYDQANVTGTVNVSGSNLLLTVSGLTATNIGQNFFIVANDGVDAITGTFNGLANLSTVTVGADVFVIHYMADTSTGLVINGNDIALTLTAVPEPGTWLAAALALGAVGYTQRRRLVRSREHGARS